LLPNLIRLGGENLNTTKKYDFKVQEIIVHPDYDPNLAYNDIALIQISGRSVDYPICLWANFDPGTESVTATGYGHKEFAGEISNILQKICAGDLEGIKDTCQGDSGGPIFMKKLFTPYAIGLTSFGGSCAHGIPAVYTRISEYLDWIENIVWGSLEAFL
uniref:Peptidase S1 domain-containing protein n=1 Tax=Megaselia scalaris TaxID=36166 RepID=T1H183_MEGSC